MNDSVLCDNTELRRIGLDDLEFNGPHTAANEESVTLSHWSVCYHGHMSKWEY